MVWIQHRDLDDIFNRLDYLAAQQSQVLNILYHLIGQDTTMAKGLDDLHAAVTGQTSIVASVSTLLQELSAKIKDAIQGDDDSAVEDLANQIAANSAALAQAVASNTQGQSSAQAAPAASSAPAPADSSAPAAPAASSDQAPAAPAPDMGNAS